MYYSLAFPESYEGLRRIPKTVVLGGREDGNAMETPT